MNRADSEGVISAFSDEGLALQFADLHEGRLRYVAEWGRWYNWTGHVWKYDSTLLALDYARGVCRKVAMLAPERGKSVASGNTIGTVLRLARADRRLAAETGQWDREAFLLNTPGGTVCLRTGDMRSHDRKDYLTKCAAVTPASGLCPMWSAFLNRIFDDDEQLIGFVQRILGYALTGCTEDHAMFFFYGTGGNGKGVLLETVTGILEDYHAVAPTEMLMASKHERHPTEIASLVGRRIVTSTETEGGKRWAEAKIKGLTGGDKLAARFVCQDFFYFTPQFKLIVAGNHKPSLNTVDEAIKRRFHLVPFVVTITDAERDPKLAEKLKAEWPQILQWMVDGCLEWQEHGLAAPAAVREATAEYLAAQDTVRNWLEECLEVVPDDRQEVLSSTLFKVWQEWCAANGEYIGSNKALSQRLQALGFQVRRTNKGAAVRGVKVKG
jgi:putative DNA primase/helicase